MTFAPAGHSVPGSVCALKASLRSTGRRCCNESRGVALLVASILLAPLLFAQGTAQITGVDPASAKVSESVTLTGTNLGKSSVPAVYLSDDKEDFKVTIVEQTNEKIVLKVPQVKSGSYRISIQAGDTILIKPIRFIVE